MGTIEKTAVIKAPASKVVKALTDQAELEKWFPTKVKSDTRVGGGYSFRFIRPGEEDHLVEGKFTKIGADRVSYTWPMPGLADTSVDWLLTDKSGETTVKMVHNDIGVGGPWDQVRGMMDPGWGMFVNNLKSFLEGGKDLRKG
jgi:uncharacterized protein YndB with AHSA1/START domain